MENYDKQKLIIPIYLNETIVMDMLAIIEDGFSMVSEINISDSVAHNSNEKVHAGFATSELFNKLLKIDLGAENDLGESKQGTKNSKSQKVHTSTSLFSRFKTELSNKGLISCVDNNKLVVDSIEIGDFIEVEGTLQKNPFVNILESALDVFKMANIFAEQPEIGRKKAYSTKKNQDQQIVKQMKMFLEELKATGTIDFVLNNGNNTIILSAQEKYLQNDNISEMLGGTFKVLGKVIHVCKDSEDSINLLRKTTLNVLKEDEMNSFTDVFKTEEFKKFNLPEVKIKIDAPAIIMIPIAIYV